MKVYLERTYSHRNFGALIGVIALIPMGGLTLWSLLRSLLAGEIPEFSIGFLLFAILMLGGAGLFFYAGVTLAYGWIANRTDVLMITDEGVKHFGKFAKWDEIKWISCGCQRKGELMLFYQKKGLGFDRFLPVTKLLSEVEIEDLFQKLRIDVGPRHKHLHIGY